MEKRINYIDYKAAKFAIEMHASVEQMYGDFPYQKHLSDVAAQIAKFCNLFPISDYPVIVAGAWCHDLIEDVHSISYNDVKQKLGVEVAELVFACTESTGRNRAERHDDAYYERIKACKYADAIKIADWIANVTESIRTGSSMLKKYRQEYPRFKEQLYQERYSMMWRKLDNLLEEGQNNNGN